MIKENVKKLLNEIPKNVKLIAATKGRTPDEILQAVEAGIEIVGENYLQNALPKIKEIGDKVKWHYIGHLQKNKVKKAVEVFDMIETVDSFKIAVELDNRCHGIDKVMPVLVEINCAREEQKHGILPEEAEKLILDISILENIKVQGLMTMGPWLEIPEDVRPYFRDTKQLFDKIKSSGIENIEMKFLSMGMSDTHRIAIEEGANIVRIGTLIFGPV